MIQIMKFSEIELPKNFLTALTEACLACISSLSMETAQSRCFNFFFRGDE